MSYTIKWEKVAFLFLDKLSSNVSERILNKLDKIKKDPFHYLEHFESKKCYKLGIGIYRALIDVDFENKVLIIQILDKRGRIYKR